jgi:hypothetical protein
MPLTLQLFFSIWMQMEARKPDGKTQQGSVVEVPLSELRRPAGQK